MTAIFLVADFLGMSHLSTLCYLGTLMMLIFLSVQDLRERKILKVTLIISVPVVILRLIQLLWQRDEHTIYVLIMFLLVLMTGWLCKRELGKGDLYVLLVLSILLSAQAFCVLIMLSLTLVIIFGGSQFIIGGIKGRYRTHDPLSIGLKGRKLPYIPFLTISYVLTGIFVMGFALNHDRDDGGKTDMELTTEGQVSPQAIAILLESLTNRREDRPYVIKEKSIDGLEPLLFDMKGRGAFNPTNYTGKGFIQVYAIDEHLQICDLLIQGDGDTLKLKDGSWSMIDFVFDYEEITRQVESIQFLEQLRRNLVYEGSQITGDLLKDLMIISRYESRYSMNDYTISCYMDKRIFGGIECIRLELQQQEEMLATVSLQIGY